MRETHIIGFSDTAERRKPSCQAGAPPGGASRRSPSPTAPRDCRSPALTSLPPSGPPRSCPSPGSSPGSAGPEPSAAPVRTYGRAGPSREQQRPAPEPQLSRRGTGGGDTRIEGAGPRPGRPGDAGCPLEEGFPQRWESRRSCTCRGRGSKYAALQQVYLFVRLSSGWRPLDFTDFFSNLFSTFCCF